MKRGCSIVLVLVGALLGSSARAESSGNGLQFLEKAKTALRDLDYETARQHLMRSLLAGDHAQDGLVTTYRFAGQVAAAFGKAEEAYDHYRRMLSLDPDATLPKGLAPKMVQPFERAKSFMAQRSRLQAQVMSHSRTRLTIAVSSDPLRLAVRVRVVSGNNRAEGTIRGGETRIPFATKPGDRVHVLALDKHGNRLDSVRWTAPRPAPVARRVSVPEAAVATDTTPAASPARPVYKRWYVWGLAAVGTGAAAAYFGMRANDDWNRLDQVINDSGNHSFAEARAIEDSGYRNQRYANIGVGVSVGLGAVATYLLIRKLGGSEKKTRIVPGITNGGGTVALKGSL